MLLHTTHGIYVLKMKRNPKGQARLYQTQYDNAKQCAKQRNIEWQFTYDSWVSWWGNDIVNRGPYKGQLVMARTNDIGPYHESNVRKATGSENGREGNLGRHIGNKYRLGKKSTPEAEAKRLASYKLTIEKKRKEKQL